MKRWLPVFLSILFTLMLAGCGYQVPLEDMTITFILGIDLDEDNNLIFYESSPVFSKEAEEKTETYHVNAETIRDSRKLFDSLTAGEVSGAKIQVLLLGKRVLEHEDWFPILDTMYRNTNFSNNTRVVVVDGQVSDVIYYKPKSTAQLVMYLKDVIDKNYKRTRTEKGTLQELHSAMYEKGMTPALSLVKKEEELELIGTSLLDERGKFVDSLDLSESTLLLFIKHKKKHPISFTSITIPTKKEGGIFHKDDMSLDIQNVKSKIKTSYEKDQFRFDIKITMSVFIIENLLPSDMAKDEKKFQRIIEKRLKSKYEELFIKIQSRKIDPIGLGLYARAYEYEQYKKVENQWGEALANAEINVTTEVNIEGMGAINNN